MDRKKPAVHIRRQFYEPKALCGSGYYEAISLAHYIHQRKDVATLNLCEKCVAMSVTGRNHAQH